MVAWSGGLIIATVSSHAHCFTVVENSGTLAGQVRRRRFSTFQADAARRSWSRLQLCCEDQRRPPPYSERVPLHVIEQVNQSTGRGTATFPETLGVIGKLSIASRFPSARRNSRSSSDSLEKHQRNRHRAMPGSGWSP